MGVQSTTGLSRRHDHLRLVSHRVDAPRLPTTVPVPLNVAPFRPGELPVISWIALDANIRDLIKRSATAAHVPIELWVRAAVESSRLVTEIATRSDQLESKIVSGLDAAARVGRAADPQTLGATALSRYADLLESSHPSGKVPPVLPLRLPEEMVGAWHHAATRKQVEMSSWIAMRMQTVPSGCISWEAAAARSHQSLEAWAYASILFASASSIA